MRTLLETAIAGQPDIKALTTWELANPRRSKAFGITAKTVAAAIDRRCEWLRSLAPHFDRFPLSHTPHFLETLWSLWLPMGIQIGDWQQALGRPLVQGVLGGQGAGKTTLAATLKVILAQLGYRMVELSLDDLYKTYADRQVLQVRNPRLDRRGPPGTHDIDLGITALDRLRREPHPQTPILVPRFDKSLHGGQGDRVEPEPVEGADIILFEGWFVGVRPIDPVAFEHPPAPIVTSADRTFALEMNAALHEYLPLWERLDRLMILHPIDYRLSQQWRLEAERQMVASGKPGMTDAQIEAFVTYFWQALHPELFIEPLANGGNGVDWAIRIEADRSFSLSL
jgi:D-glycerate 3-kinase